MLDRQDIDALLIGALYGELTPADEARLQTHLESHPADRTALADLTLARNAVRESRILQVQVEPPQSISALLLQEAARRAPKPTPAKARDEEREGWFARFVRSFAAHPAMAAAAMLVLVLGVAGTVYLKKGDTFSEQHAAPTLGNGSSVNAPAAQTATPPAAEPSLADESEKLRKNAGSAYGATLGGDGLEGRGEAAPPPAPEPSPNKGAAKERRDTYLSTERPDLKPKDLDDDRARPKTSRTATPKTDAKTGSLAQAQDAEGTFKLEDKSAGAVAGPADTGASGGGAASADRSRVAAPSGTVGRVPAQDPSRAGNAAPTTPPATTEEQTDTALVGWAKDMHQKMIAQVRANNCKTATTLALELSNRAPGYYAQNVETDRALKQCVQYINAARAEEAERVQRARATQKRSVDEQKRAAPASTSK
ncbi:MAG TPA: hypothetical protein VFQ53_04075 [Kofleriaceae bacterium]|nr:hypothetical protein [Kofleriaceae bacterium]